MAPSKGALPIRTSLRALILVAGALGVVIFCWAIYAYPWRPEIGGSVGVVLWILVAALGAAAPVQMAGGTLVDVTVAPIVAAGVLGGPGAAALVATIGTIEGREIRGLMGRSGGIPWYGSVYNHASITIPAVAAAAAAVLLVPTSFAPSLLTLAEVGAIGLGYLLANNLLTALAIALRDGRPVRSVMVANLRQFGMSLAGLAPLAWLMAAMYVVAGPIGVIPFAVPLYATRAGYKKVVEIRNMFTQTVRSLAGAVDAKDPYTAGHSERVQRIAKDLGGELRCSDGELEALEWGGLLHDIGKIGIPDAILLKEGALTREERMVMNAHPVKGEEIIRPVEKLAPELPIIRHHHEWYNGSGYPDRLVGHEIPKLARILHVADSYEAMTAARPYRLTPLTQKQAIAELHKFSGIQFDPEVIAAFDRLIAREPEWITPNIPEGLRQTRIPRLGEADAGPVPA